MTVQISDAVNDAVVCSTDSVENAHGLAINSETEIGTVPSLIYTFTNECSKMKSLQHDDQEINKVLS